MSIPFVDRSPTTGEVERLRLILSTYQDGSGMLAQQGARTIPGWKDFERSVAVAFGGNAQESKAIFDVLLPDITTPHIFYGLSCKMRATLDKVLNSNRITIELSNSAGKFWQYLRSKRIDQANYRDMPFEVGCAVIELVEQWHQAVSTMSGGRIELARSSYLVLSYNKRGLYQLHQIPLTLPSPRTLKWHFPIVVRKGIGLPANHLRGENDQGILFEWYGESGGQLKYYPTATSAIWQSDLFELEELQIEGDGIVLLRKAEAYFPQLWTKVSNQP